MICATIIIVMFLTIGCEKAAEKKLEKEIGGDVDIDKKGDETKITIKSDDGEAEMEINSKNADDWCAEGSTLKSSGQDGSMNMVVLGIEKSGKYKGYCHMKYDIESKEETGSIEFYHDKDGNGFQVMDINGEKMEMEWNKG